LASQLALAFPGRAIDEGHIVSWAQALQGYGIEIADDIVALLRLRCTDPPAVALIHETAKEIRREMQNRQPSYYNAGPRGEVMSGDDIAHGRFHLRRYWEADRSDAGELQRAKVPRACDCGWADGETVKQERLTS
jgi:hypothetical protein